MGFTMLNPMRYVAVLWCFAVVSSALSLPAILRNNSSQNHILSASLTNLTAPDPAPGLTVKYVDFKTVVLNPTQIVINAIEMMIYLTQLPFQSLVVHPVYMTCKGFSTELMIDLSPMPERLTINYAALALLQMGNRIAMERAFFSQWGRIVKDGRTQCGILKFQRISSPETYESSLLNSAPLNSSDSNGNGIERVVAPYEANITGDIFSAVSTGDSSTGRIIDPKNKLLVVDFRFRGEPMKGSEVFMCFLDALATATDHDPREVGATIDSYSGTFDTWLHVMHLDSPRYYQEGLNWGTMIRVLQLIWEQAIMGNSPDRRGLKPQYQGMEFEVFKAGVKIGAGDLWSVGVKSVDSSK